MAEWNDSWKKAMDNIKDDEEMLRIKDFMFLEYLYGAEGKRRLKASGMGITVAFKRDGRFGPTLTIDEAYNKARRGFKYDRIKFIKHRLDKPVPKTVVLKEVMPTEIETVEVDILHMDVRVVRVRMFDKMKKLVKTTLGIRILM